MYLFFILEFLCARDSKQISNRSRRIGLIISKTKNWQQKNRGAKFKKLKKILKNKIIKTKTERGR